MNKNQKIAIGCGAVGCLGLIILALAGGGVYLYMANQKSTVATRPLPTRIENDNRSNSNANQNENENRSQGDEDDNNSNSSPQTGSRSTMSDDARHRLFQAAGMTGDSTLTRRVMEKLKLLNADGSMTAENKKFVQDHITWAVNNVDFIQSVSTPEKAKAYVDAHIND